MMIERFIDASDILVREIVKKIISNTHHISFESFIISFNEMKILD